MAAIEISVDEWSEFLADETIDVEIEGILVEDPIGQAFDYLDEDFSAYLSKTAVLKIHDGVVHTNGDVVCLRKYLSNWVESRKEKLEEITKKPHIYILFDDVSTQTKVENILNSMKLNLNIDMEIVKGVS